MTQTNTKQLTNVLSSDWRALFLLNFYRFSITSLLTGAFVLDIAPKFIGQFNGKLFLITGNLYLIFSIINVFTIHRRWPPFNVQVFNDVLIDILAITLLMHASGGVNSGLGVLLGVAVAGGSLLTIGRTAFFFAAVASISVLLHVTLEDVYHWQITTNYTHAGMLGTTFFATAFLAYTLAKRARASELLAQQRAISLQYLTHLNAQIVKHIKSGIMVIDIVGRIHLSNEAARLLLGLTSQPEDRTLGEVVPELAEHITQWRENPSHVSHLFRPADGDVDIISTFTELRDAGSISVLIVLEDATLITHRAQQLKLASLGRLTASIAHEVRNPLGAISHAGQLLAELPDLPASSARLIRIIVAQSQRVNTIIESVLQLSRRESPRTESFDLHSWLQAFVEDFTLQHSLTADDIVIHAHHQPLMVYFDPSQLTQVVNNLCENGLRYSRGKPLLELTIETHVESNHTYLDVRDHGSGMSQETVMQIFEPFFTTEPKGTGLGLYISREICEANQATLHLPLNTEYGCCFRINFARIGEQAL